MRGTTESFVKRAQQVHGDRYDYSQSEYVNAHMKVKILCRTHGMFEQTPANHIYGKCGCPVCAGNVRSNTTEFIKKARDVHGCKYDYSHVVYVDNKTPVDIVCSEHGIFSQSPTNHLCGKGCPRCANNVVSDSDSFIKRAVAVHGDLYDYSQVEYRNSRDFVTIVCKRHGPFAQRPYSHLAGCGCPLCGIEHQVENRDEIKIRAKAAQTCLDRYGVSNPMFDSDIRNRQQQSVSSDESKAKSVATKRANHSFNTSLAEYRLVVLLRSMFGEDDVADNYVSSDYPFKCDFYIKSRHLYIELNAHWSHGGHWYSNADEYVISEWRGKSKFFKNAAETFSVRDVTKRRVASEHRLNYVVFWKSDLSDAYKWIELGCPDGQDWLNEYSWLS